MQAMLIMTSIIRVGQSKFVSVQIDEDSNERIMNCIQTLSELKIEPIVQEVFLDDTKAAFSKMLGAQEVSLPTFSRWGLTIFVETCCWKEGSWDEEGGYRSGRWSADIPAVLEEDGWRGHRCKSTLHSYEVSFLYIEQDDEDVGRATGAGEVQEDFISNLSRIAQLTGKACYADRQ